MRVRVEITGEPGQGKTTTAIRIARALRAEGVVVVYQGRTKSIDRTVRRLIKHGGDLLVNKKTTVDLVDID